MSDRSTKIADDFRFNECPRWHNGALYCVDMHDNRVCKIESSGQVRTVVEVEHPAGLGWLPNGDMLVVASRTCKIYRHDGSRLIEHADLTGRGLAIINDMVIDEAGDGYVGALLDGFAEGSLPPSPIFRVGADGAVRVAADGLHCPNGMVTTPDGKTLIVAESFASRLTAFDIDGDGNLSGRRVWAAFDGEEEHSTVASIGKSRSVIPDGIALDRQGAIWVADARGGGALRVWEGGEIIERRTFGADTAIATAVGGSDQRTLYAMVGPPFDRLAEVFQSKQRLFSVHASQF